jgi:hypothetical protein
MDEQAGRGERDQRMERLERRLDSLEQRTGVVDRSRAAMDMLVPNETRRHLRAAGREQLLAVRSLLDHWIRRLRDDDKPAPETRENIPVD